MITRTEAVAIFQSYNRSFSDRVEAQIRSAASAGLTSIDVPYGNVTNAIAAAVAAELTAAGWTVVNNVAGKTITIS